MTFRIYKSDRTDPMSLFGTHPSELWSTRADAPQKSSTIHRMVNALPGVNHRWKLFESNVKRYQSIKTMNDKAGDLDVDRGESYLEVRDSEDGDNLLHSAIEVLAKLDGEDSNEWKVTVGNVKTLESLMNEGNYFGVTPLMLATSKGENVLRALVNVSETKPNLKLEDSVYHKNAMEWALNTETANILSVSMKSFNIEELPDLPQDKILAHLPCTEVLKMCLLGKSGIEMCKDQNFWKKQYKLRHDVSAKAAYPIFPSLWSKELRDPSNYRLEYENECKFVIGKTHKTIADSEVTSVTFSPDGSTLATGSMDKTAKLWGVHSLELKRTFEGHTDCVYTVAFSPDGNLLATGSGDGTAKLWDVNSGELKRTLPGHNDRVNSVVFSPDGLTLATSGSHNVWLWNAQSGDLKKTFREDTKLLLCFAFSPDWSTLAIGCFERTVILLDAHSLELKRTFEAHIRLVISVAFSPDGRTIATGSWDKTAKLWDVNTGTLIHSLEVYEVDVLAVAFSPDGSLLATGANDGTAKLWDAQSGVLKATIQNLYSAFHLAFSPDGHTLAIGSRLTTENAANLWSVLA